MTKEFRSRVPALNYPGSSIQSCRVACYRAIRSLSHSATQLICSSLLVILALAGCSSAEQKPAPPPPGVTITPVVQKEVPIHQEWVGTMVGNVDAEIRPKVEGFLLARLYTEGSFVLKGQPLITEGMKEIVTTLLEAIVLVIIVVFLFLQNWRATLIPLLAVPVSLVGTFAVFPMLGFSINTLSLFGLILAIGLVVDDAIVVVEAVEHHIEHGLSPKDATFKAMEEVTAPVIGIALILSSVFVPMAAMGGIKGLLNQQFAVTIAISVLISAFNALTLSPALSALLLRPRKKGRGPLGKFFDWFNVWFGRMTGGYVSWSGVLIRRWGIALLILLGISIIAVGMGKKLPASFIPEEDQGYAFLQIQLPDAASLQRTDAVMRKIDEMLAHTHGVQSYSGISGFSLLSNTSASYTGFYFLQLEPWEERLADELSAQGLMRSLNQKMAKEIPEAIGFAFGPPAIPGLGTAGGFTFMLQDRSGGTVTQLSEMLDKLSLVARKRPEIASIVSTFRPSVPQLYVEVDQDRVLKQGLQFTEVYQTLQAFLGGAYVNQFNRFGRQWKVYLQAEPEYRTSADKINNFYVRNSKGDMTPLASLVTIKRVSGPEYTNRFNLFRSIQINGSPAPGFSSGQAMAAMEQVSNEVLPAGFGYAWSDMSYQEKKAEGGQAMVFAMSFVFVFLILVALYESWSLPFSVLLSVPVAVLGAYGGLLFRKFDNNVFAQIGLIMLIGLTAKNAILIVEFAVLEHSKGKQIVEAALEGARLRLRPILMTSFAFILGCVPLWTAKGAGAIGRKVLGSSVIMGMSAATILGIFLVPVLFVVVERVAKKQPHVEVAHPAVPWREATTDAKSHRRPPSPLRLVWLRSRAEVQKAHLSDSLWLLHRTAGIHHFRRRSGMVGTVQGPCFARPASRGLQ